MTVFSVVCFVWNQALLQILGTSLSSSSYFLCVQIQNRSEKPRSEYVVLKLRIKKIGTVYCMPKL